MKFDEKYPDALPWSSANAVDYNFEGDTIFKGNRQDACAECSDMTDWISLSFECMLCSEECNLKMWQGYFEALRNS